MSHRNRAHWPDLLHGAGICADLREHLHGLRARTSRFPAPPVQSHSDLQPPPWAKRLMYLARSADRHSQEWNSDHAPYSSALFLLVPDWPVPLHTTAPFPCFSFLNSLF